MDLSDVSEELARAEGQINDIFRALSNGFQKLDKIRDSNRPSRQLEELTDKMRECKRLIKEFERVMKEEENMNTHDTNKMLNERKQSMIKELNSYVALKKQHASENKRIDLFDDPGGGDGFGEENVLLASSMTNQQLMDHGNHMMDETDQTIERAKKMELLNVKLYEKYKNLKKRKFTEEEEWSHTRDAELRSFQSAVEDLIEELNKENKGLHQQLYSFQEKYAECKMLLLEEGKKSKELSDEIEKLQNLLLKKNDMNNTLLFTSPSTNSKVRSEEILKSPSGRRITESCKENGTQHKVSTIITYDNKKTATSTQECYRRNFSSPGKQSEDRSNFIFQTLMRFLVGMDFYIDNQTESPSILVAHKTSGYSFSLTWIQQEGGDEGEWMYHVSSLGTLESVALDWMKEDIIFSAAMCRDFFERVSLIVGRM